MGCKIYSYSIEGGIEFAKQQLIYDNLSRTIFSAYTKLRAIAIDQTSTRFYYMQT